MSQTCEAACHSSKPFMNFLQCASDSFSCLLMLSVMLQRCSDAQQALSAWSAGTLSCGHLQLLLSAFPGCGWQLAGKFHL